MEYKTDTRYFGRGADLMKNNKLKLFKFLSVIYNPTKYPLKYSSVNKIANEMFCKKYAKKLLQNFSGSDLGYYIDIKNDLFDLDKFVSRINSTIKYVEKNPNLLWGLLPSFDRYEIKQNFLYKLHTKISFKNKKILLQVFTKEINKVKEIATIILKKRDIDQINYLLNKDKFNMVKYLCDYPPYYSLKNSIKNYLYLLYTKNKKNWVGTIKEFKNPIIQISLNYLYSRENYLLFIKQINNNDTKLIKSLFIMNCLSQVIDETTLNKRIITNIVNRIADFDDKFYWLGILLSNGEYIIPRTKDWVLKYIEKKTKAKIVDLLNDTATKESVEEYKTGLKQTPRNTSLRHFNVFYKLKNKEISLYLMQELINDYKEQISKKRLYLTDNIDIDYINSLIDAISILCLDKKLNYKIFFEEILNSFLLTEEDYKYNFSEMIETRSTVLHIFLTLFGTIEVLNKRIKLENDEIEKMFDKFLKYINLFMFYDDDIFYIDKVFKLKIFRDKKMILKEIKHLYEDVALPEFSTISILISKTKKTQYIKKIIKDTSIYFDKYYNEWLKNQIRIKYYIFKKWEYIFIRLKDIKRATICRKILQNRV